MSFRSLALPALLALITGLEAVGANSSLDEAASAPAANQGVGEPGGGLKHRPPLEPAREEGGASARQPESSVAIVRDVGDSLAYARVPRAPADLPASEQIAGRAVILDLRFSTDDGTADAPLAAFIRAAAGPKRPVFLLVNAETSARLLRTVSTLDTTPGVITIAPSSRQLTADFQVVVTPDEERRAYEAFAAGKSVVELTTDLPEKRRNDEASLTQHPPAGDPPLDDPDDEAAPLAETATAKKPKPVIDVALQRAVHLYRGLRALKVL